MELPLHGSAGSYAMRMLDAHVHFWRLGHHDCTWPPPDLAAIHRDFLPDDWQCVASPHGVQAAIAVQSQASERDTAWVLDIAAADPRIAGVVGWTDLAAPDAPSRVATLAKRPKLRGLRPMLQDLPEDDWILKPVLRPAIDAMAAHGLRLDALVRVRQLRHLVRFAVRHPGLGIVVDHAGKPPLATGDLAPWRTQMAALAQCRNVVCKLSGLATEAGADWRRDDLAPCVDHLLATFGPDRLLWGSDWPVVNLASSYADWLRCAGELTRLPAVQRAAVFGGNAARMYGIGTTTGPARTATPYGDPGPRRVAGAP